ncbi:MAG: glycine/betaine ABC transporter permease [Pseudomonadota bacterium]|nr:glycine/betaine ABC transporter permease [Pseudomonadota bacterium]
MQRSVIALFHNPWPDQLDRPRDRNPARLYRYAIWYKANPRSAEYMKNLLGEHFPESEWINTADQLDWQSSIGNADEVVLLYPDAIGLGFSAMERIILKHKKTWAGVTVLNGRGRQFRQNGATRLGLRSRRLLEWTMLPEMIFLALFLLLTPILWVFDLARGRT